MKCQKCKQETIVKGKCIACGTSYDYEPLCALLTVIGLAMVAGIIYICMAGLPFKEKIMGFNDTKQSVMRGSIKLFTDTQIVEEEFPIRFSDGKTANMKGLIRYKVSRDKEALIFIANEFGDIIKFNDYLISNMKSYARDSAAKQKLSSNSNNIIAAEVMSNMMEKFKELPGSIQMVLIDEKEPNKEYEK